MSAINFPLESDRLFVRPFVGSDALAAHVIYGDPEVMRYVAYGVANQALSDTEQMIANYGAHQTEHGFAFWALFEKASGSLIGDVGFEVGSNSNVEFGYTLGREWWGKGYATEASSLCIDAAINVLGLTSLHALVDPANPASAHVLDKLGFVEAGSKSAYGRDHKAYVLTL